MEPEFLTLLHFESADMPLHIKYFQNCCLAMILPVFWSNYQMRNTQVHFNATTVLQPPQGLLFDRGFLRNYCTDLDALWYQIRVWSQLATHQRATKSDHKQLRNQHGENDVQNGKRRGNT